MSVEELHEVSRKLGIADVCVYILETGDTNPNVERVWAWVQKTEGKP